MNNLQRICLKNGYLLHPKAKVRDFKELFENKVKIDFSVLDDEIPQELENFFKGIYIEKFKDLKIIFSEDLKESIDLLTNLLIQTKGKPQFKIYFNLLMELRNTYNKQ